MTACGRAPRAAGGHGQGLPLPGRRVWVNDHAAILVGHPWMTKGSGVDHSRSHECVESQGEGGSLVHPRQWVGTRWRPGLALWVAGAYLAPISSPSHPGRISSVSRAYLERISSVSRAYLEPPRAARRGRRGGAAGEEARQLRSGTAKSEESEGSLRGV